jgi:D-alanyl-lipoteichoic acid acyltransferase DltB (MBOAT superfamily)
MLFNTIQFAIFLALVLALHRLIPRSARNPLLLGASLLFYTLWIPAYLPLLVIDILVNWALVRAMARSERPRLFLALSIVFTIGLLAYFKYAAMIVTTLLPVLEWGSGHPVAAPDILLPLGISFYSFQIVAFSVDCYWRRETQPPSLGRYALFIAFFPQLIAGPIVRGSQFLPQLDGPARSTPEQVRRGLWLLASGIAKKVVVADFLIAPFVDQVFAEPGVASAPFHWVAAWSFCFQVYFDFSGYTDMGRGMALLLGFELPMNFTEPYLSRNPTEFWRRWHITLSRWLGDYLFIPLGGASHGNTRTYLNLVFTMLLGGLWHGAGWNFVIWGGIHGALLALHWRFGDRERLGRPLAWDDAWRILLHFNVYALVFVFFRSGTFSDALAFFGGLATGGAASGWPVMQCGILLLCVASHGLERFLRPRLPALHAACARSGAGPALEGLALGALLALALMVSGAGGEFIYFQF